jgi:K(+)-stimulated pyrophosphate-energized sodium pump
MGIIASLIGILCVRVKEGGNVQGALNTGNYISVLSRPWLLTSHYVDMPPVTFTIRNVSFIAMGVFYAVVWAWWWARS